VRDAADVAGAVGQLRPGTVVVKAQVLIGGRGKAGGVKLARTAGEAEEIAAGLLGSQLTTHQGSEPVEAVLLEEGAAIERELYLAILVDRNRAEAVLLGSGRGGVDIEELARTDPDAIVKIPFDTRAGLPAGDIHHLAAALAIEDTEALADFVGRLTTTFRDRDCLLLEINPLVVTATGTLLALDAKLIVDDNAAFKHPDLPANPAESPLEAEARAAGLSWVDLGGDIACLVNGAGLAMATADAIKFAGGEPANFLDIGGAADQARLQSAFRLLLRQQSVRAVLVNVFGGIVQCDLVAQALVEALRAFPDCPPIVIRLEGTNIEEARQIIARAAGSLHTADTVDQAARRAVAFAREA
jgi:succinyl-CoA synthetase beta subunit